MPGLLYILKYWALSWDVIKLSEIIIIIITIILFSSSSFSLFSFLPLFHLPPPHLPSLPLLIFLFLLLSKFRNLRALSTTYCGLSNASSVINPYSLTGKIKLFCQTCVNSPLIISYFSFPCFLLLSQGTLYISNQTEQNSLKIFGVFCLWSTLLQVLVCPTCFGHLCLSGLSTFSPLISNITELIWIFIPLPNIPES